MLYLAVYAMPDSTTSVQTFYATSDADADITSRVRRPAVGARVQYVALVTSN